MVFGLLTSRGKIVVKKDYCHVAGKMTDKIDKKIHKHVEIINS